MMARHVLGRQAVRYYAAPAHAANVIHVSKERAATAGGGVRSQSGSKQKSCASPAPAVAEESADEKVSVGEPSARPGSGSLLNPRVRVVLTRTVAFDTRPSPTPCSEFRHGRVDGTAWRRANSLWRLGTERKGNGFLAGLRRLLKGGLANGWGKVEDGRRAGAPRLRELTLPRSSPLRFSSRHHLPLSVYALPKKTPRSWCLVGTFG